MAASSSSKPNLSSFCDDLQRTGCWVHDDDTGTLADDLRDEIELLYESDLLIPSCNRLATARDPVSGEITQGEVIAKPGVFELELMVDGKNAGGMGPMALAMCPRTSHFVEQEAPDLARLLGEACPELTLTGEVDTIKVSLSPHPFPQLPLLSFIVSYSNFT